MQDVDLRGEGLFLHISLLPSENLLYTPLLTAIPQCTTLDPTY